MSNRESVPSFPNSIWERPCRGNSIAPHSAKDEIICELAYFAGINEALAQSERGEGVPIEDARRLIKSWTS
jgi:predicted transcriptional regulator